MGEISEKATNDKKIESPTLASLNDLELQQFRAKQDYKSRLAEYLTGYPLEDGEVILNKVITDKQTYHKELNFPKVEDRIDNPSLYGSEIRERVKAEGIKIISFKDVPDWLLEKDSWIKQTRENDSPTAGCYSEDLDSIIIGDPNSTDPKILKSIAHELVHAIDYKRMKQEDKQSLSIEELEYRAYLMADVSERKLKSVDGVEMLNGLFGDFGVAGSSFGFYLGKSLETGESKNFSDFMNKSNKGEIKIPWFGPREIKADSGF